jgi:hypothetical protein
VGSLPSLLHTKGLAPPSNNKVRHFPKNPFMLITCNGVLPLQFATLGSHPFANNSSIAETFVYLQAFNKGVFPTALQTFALALWERRS